MNVFLSIKRSVCSICLLERKAIFCGLLVCAGWFGIFGWRGMVECLERGKVTLVRFSL